MACWQSKVMNGDSPIFGAEAPALFGVRKNRHAVAGIDKSRNHCPKISCNSTRTSISVRRFCCYEADMQIYVRALLRAENITCPANSNVDFWESHSIVCPPPNPRHCASQLPEKIKAAKGASIVKAIGSASL